MRDAHVAFDGGEVVELRVGRPIAMDTLLRDKEQILQHLRSSLKCGKLKMQVEVDEALADDADHDGAPVPKPLTIQEKYLKMNELNPMVEVLRNRFNLKVDTN